MSSDQNQMDSQLQRSLDQLDQQFNSQQDNSDNQSNSQQSNPQSQQSQQNPQQPEAPSTTKPARTPKPTLTPTPQQSQQSSPYTVIVQGSASSGKSTLIRSLVKHYTKYKIAKIQGTVTMRSTRKQRVSLYQCQNDLRAMIDLAKIADIVVIVIDASLGFQMETFQFLSLLKVSGFPTVIGVLTHLDYYTQSKQLRKIKKRFKKRFQYEVGGNSKLFSISSTSSSLYPKIEVSKIARYIGTVQPQQIPWRQHHPFLLADRWQLAQDGQYKDNDEVSVEFYGYVRGGSWRINGRVGVVGVGEFGMGQGNRDGQEEDRGMKKLVDPCPEWKKGESRGDEINMQVKQEEFKRQENQSDQENDQSEEQKPKLQSTTQKKNKKRRTLSQNQRIIYAPFCNLGSLSFEHTSGFVTIPHQYVKFTRKQHRENEQGDVKQQNQQEQQIEQGVQMVRNLQDLRQGINKKLQKQQQIQLLPNLKLLNPDQSTPSAPSLSKKTIELQSLAQKAHSLQLVSPSQSHNRHQNLSYLIYESKQEMVTYDCSKFHPEPDSESGNLENFKGLFVTGMEGDMLGENGDDEEDSDSADRQKRKEERDVERILKQNVKKMQISQKNNFFPKGSYTKLTLTIPYSTYRKLSLSLPVILFRPNLGQSNLSYLKVNFKRHRWYPNLLKSTDPIIISSGWYRYQSLIYFAHTDQNQRLRYLKYTPQADFCTGIFYGNFVQQGTGCTFMQTIRGDVKKFRISGTGLVMEMSKGFQIMKKVKLIGQPMKIWKNTAFVKGMFTSAIEAGNYIGAQIRTVSGIRGQIKKVVKQGGEGTFRATFQDKILMSDIVFCRAWYRMVLERFYNPVLSFGKNRLMKTRYQLRIQKGIDLEMKPDSQYKNVDRAPAVFKPLMVPKKLQSKLPFKTLQKVTQSKKKRIQQAQSLKIPKILQSESQQQISSLIQRLNTIKNAKQQLKQQKLKQKQKIWAARQKPKQQYYDGLKKQRKAEKMAALGRKNRREEERENGERGRGKGGSRGRRGGSKGSQGREGRARKGEE